MELISVMPPFCWAVSADASPVSHSPNQVVFVAVPIRVGSGVMDLPGKSVLMMELGVQAHHRSRAGQR